MGKFKKSKFKKSKFKKSKNKGVMFGETDKGKWMRISGRIKEKGKSGLTAFVGHAKYGDVRVSLQPWGADDDNKLTLFVPKSSIVVKDDKVIFRIPITPMGEWDEDKIKEFVEEDEEEEEEEEESEEEESEEEEEEEEE